MILTIIGMSGTGKTYWSKKLEKKGFVRYCCDDLIETALGDILKKQGFRGIQDVSKWMGQPYDHRYKKTSNVYLAEETKVMQKLLADIVGHASDQHVVIDTTGSVIYTKAQILEELSAKTNIVRLETPQEIQDKMFQLYITDPKPVIWGDVFTKRSGETDRNALARCYPTLLKTRAQKYKKLAHRTLDYHTLRSKDYTVDRFLIDALNKLNTTARRKVVYLL